MPDIQATLDRRVERIKKAEETPSHVPLKYQEHRICGICGHEAELLGHEWTGADGMIRFEKEPIEATRVFDDWLNNSRPVTRRDAGAIENYTEPAEDKRGRLKKGDPYWALLYEFYCPTCDGVLTRAQTAVM